VPAGSVPKPHTAPEVPTGSTRSSAEPFRDFIEAELGKGRNAKAIFQDLVLHRGYDGSYDAIKRLARKLRRREPKISCRFETEPGQEAQVDYGEGAPVRDPRTGKYRKPRLFAMTTSLVSPCAYSYTEEFAGSVTNTSPFLSLQRPAG
jgi:transposase